MEFWLRGLVRGDFDPAYGGREGRGMEGKGVADYGFLVS